MSSVTNGTQSTPVTQTDYGQSRVDGVTDTDCLHGGTVKSRNAPTALEEAEAVIQAMTGTDRNVPAEVAKREARMLRWRAKKDGGVCGKCGRDLTPGETAFMACVWSGYLPLTGGYSRQYGPVCGGCAPPRMKGEGRYYRPELDRCEQGHCETCGRPVVWYSSRWDYYRRHVFCSERCQWTHYNGLRNERNARARKKACKVWGEWFTAARRDAKTFSQACKQKAYRQRRGAA